MKIIFTGDVCFKNQHELGAELAKQTLAPEGVGEPIVKAGPNIIGRPQNLAFLTETGCDLAVLANNHTADLGDEPLCRERCRTIIRLGADAIVPFEGEELDKMLASLKNLLSCEAHNELCRTTLNLAFFGELEAAREWKQELDELAKLPC